MTFLAELLAERFGPPPDAERFRPLRPDVGDGGDDTPDAIERRRLVLADALATRDPRRAA